MTGALKINITSLRTKHELAVAQETIAQKSTQKINWKQKIGWG